MEVIQEVSGLVVVRDRESLLHGEGDQTIKIKAALAREIEIA